MPAPLFLITLRYLQPLEEVERHLEAHRAYLRQGYAQGVFLASGRLEPRTGGVILARAADRAAVDTLVQGAIAAGGKAHRPSQDLGFMYSQAFEDPDGHIWEPFWMDPQARPPQG